MPKKISSVVGPTPERLRKAGRDVEAVSGITDRQERIETIRVLDGSPLEKLATLGKRSPAKGITGEQYHAGVRYYGDAYKAGLLSSGVIDTTREKVDGGGRVDITASAIEAQGRFNAAVRSLDHEHRHILSDVVLSEVPLTVYADRFRSFPQARERRAIALHTLRTALDRLDLHYLGKRQARDEVSHLDDYRPTIGGE